MAQMSQLLLADSFHNYSLSKSILILKVDQSISKNTKLVYMYMTKHGQLRDLGFWELPWKPACRDTPTFAFTPMLVMQLVP